MLNYPPSTLEKLTYTQFEEYETIVSIIKFFSPLAQLTLLGIQQILKQLLVPMSPSPVRLTMEITYSPGLSAIQMGTTLTQIAIGNR